MALLRVCARLVQTSAVAQARFRKAPSVHISQHLSADNTSIESLEPEDDVNMDAILQELKAEDSDMSFDPRIHGASVIEDAMDSSQERIRLKKEKVRTCPRQPLTAAGKAAGGFPAWRAPRQRKAE